jgi:ABC-type bacteriocin/lantibiotic exporter with double-glycine peptidase domain
MIFRPFPGQFSEIYSRRCPLFTQHAFEIDRKTSTALMFCTKRTQMSRLSNDWRCRHTLGRCNLSSVAHQQRSPSPWLPVELRWLIGQIRPLVHWHVFSFLCITAGSLLALLTPLVLKWLIDVIIPHRRMGLLLLAVALIFVAHEGRIALASLGSYLMLTASQKMSLSLRVTLLRHLGTLSADFYENTPVGTIMYPLKEPIDEISYLGSDLLPAILRMLLTTGFTLATMFVLSPLLTLAVLPLVPVFLIARQHFRRKLASDADDVQSDRLVWSNFLEEHLSSALSIHLLGQEKRQERRAFQLLARSVRSQQKLYRTGTWFTVVSSVAVVLSMCAVIGYGGASVMAGTMSIGSLVAFYGFVAQLFDPLSGASDLYARAQKIFASIRQVQSTFALRPSVTNVPGALVLSTERLPQIEFARVEFSYPRQKELLRIPSLRVLAGEHLAIAGENGAGKSTLAKLIVRLYDPSAGSIRVGGEDIRNIQLKSLRETVCYLARDPVLFDGTIASNLRFARQAASEEELAEVIQSVGLSDLITSLPEGLRQRIGPGGCQLSGGERQRLALARTLLQKPRVLILDEATSCLDPAGEATILQKLRHNLDASTLVVISHRPSTLSTFSRVLVVSGGLIVNDSVNDSFFTSPCTRSESTISTD